MQAALTEAVGWFSTTVLLLTIGRQVWTQWRTRSTQGVSKWLFVGQLVASSGFVVYSFLLDNWVFVVSNVMMLIIALIGQGIYLANRRRAQRTGGPAASAAAAG